MPSRQGELPEGAKRPGGGASAAGWPAAQQGWKMAAGICLTDRMRGRKAMCGRMSRSAMQRVVHSQESG